MTLEDVKSRVMENKDKEMYETWFPEALKEFYEANKNDKFTVFEINFYKLKNSKVDPPTDGIVVLKSGNIEAFYYITIIGEEFWFHYTEDPYTKYVTRKEIHYVKI